MELVLGDEGNNRELGGLVTVKESSTSASGGAVSGSGGTSIGGTEVSGVVFLFELRRLDE